MTALRREQATSRGTPRHTLLRGLGFCVKQPTLAALRTWFAFMFMRHYPRQAAKREHHSSKWSHPSAAPARGIDPPPVHRDRAKEGGRDTSRNPYAILAI